MIRILLIIYISLIIFPVYGKTNISHAIAMHGEPKYKKDFKHLDYVDHISNKREILPHSVNISNKGSKQLMIKPWF